MKKFENFKAALVNLNDIFSYKEPYGNVEIAGMVGLYEICFEQSWKAMKELLENFGYAEGATGSPRTILKTAYKAGLFTGCINTIAGINCIYAGEGCWYFERRYQHGRKNS